MALGSVVRRVATAVLCTAVPSAPVAQAQPVTVTAGVSARASAGTFGSDHTSTGLYLPATVRLEIGRIETAWSLPFLGIMDGTAVPSAGGMIPMQGTLGNEGSLGMAMSAHAPGAMGSAGSMMTGNGGMGTAGMAAGQYGVGDIVGGVGYRVVDNLMSGVQVVLGARVKIPVASASKGLGTGRMDAGASVSVRKQFTRGWAYAEGGYLRIGEPPATALRNPLVWNVGMGRTMSPKTSFVASVIGNSVVVPGFSPPLEIGAGVGIRVGPDYTLTVLPSIGVTRASPRVALTIGASRTVFSR